MPPKPVVSNTSPLINLAGAGQLDLLADALRHLLRARPDLRINLAIHRYRQEPLSLAQAAALAGVSWSQMRAIMVERGEQPCLGPETVDEARAEVDALCQQL